MSTRKRNRLVIVSTVFGSVFGILTALSIIAAIAPWRKTTVTVNGLREGNASFITNRAKETAEIVDAGRLIVHIQIGSERISVDAPHGQIFLSAILIQDSNSCFLISLFGMPVDELEVGVSLSQGNPIEKSFTLVKEELQTGDRGSGSSPKKEVDLSLVLKESIHETEEDNMKSTFVPRSILDCSGNADRLLIQIDKYSCSELVIECETVYVVFNLSDDSLQVWGRENWE